LGVEELEPRLAPAANLTLTNVSFFDTNAQPITSINAGQLIYVVASFTTQNLPSNASYRVAYTVNGFTQYSDQLTYGAGASGTGSWYEYRGYFDTTPGTNQVSVTVDPDQSVAESTYADNSMNVTFNGMEPTVGYFTYSVAQMRAAYGLNSIPNFGSATPDGSGQTIALVEAGNDPAILNDLDGFDQGMSLSLASSESLYQQYGAASSFVNVYNQYGQNITANIGTSGANGVPTADPSGGWEGEETLDVEWAHAIAPGARIDIIETNFNAPLDNGFLNDPDLDTGNQVAASLPGVSVVSNSWGIDEFSGQTAYDSSTFVTPSGHTGVTFLAGSGDGGAHSYGGTPSVNDADSFYPSSSPNVVSVGATQLTLDNNAYGGETGWSYGTPRTLDNGSAAYTQTGSWVAHSGGFSGSYSTAQGGTSSSASWTTSLTNSDYGWGNAVEVSATWTPNAANATDATYTVYDGTASSGTVIGVIPVDQTRAPDGTADSNSQFQELGNFYPTSGTITVVLNSASANGTVVADAIGIAPAWASSGGPSQYESEPSYQDGFQSTGSRTTPDVSFDGSGNSGVTVYQNGGWYFDYAGTSLATPCWAGLIAIANQGRVAEHGTTLNSSANPQQALDAIYSLPSSDFNAVTSGYNGFDAGPGYNYVAGRGSPIANLLIPDLVSYGVKLNDGVLTITANTDSSSIKVSLSDSGAVDVTLDGQQQHFNPGLVSSIVVDGLGGSDSLTVDDTGTAFGQTYTVAAGSITRSGAQPITYSDVPNVTLDAGNSGDTVNWQGDAADTTVTVDTGTGTNTVNMRDADNTLDSFLGTPVLQGHGHTTANVYDQGSLNPHTYVITGTSLTRDGGTGYLYGLTATNYNLGDGGNVIDWQGTAAGDITTVYSGTGTNTINMGDGAQTLDEFASTPDLVGQGTANTLNYYDQGTTSAPFWNGFAGNSQHTADSSVPAQPLTGVSWQAPVDDAPQYTSGGEILEHYGEPVVTQANTVLIPLKTGASGAFAIQAIDGNSGAVRWTIATDWQLPNAAWVPSYNVVETNSGRVYFAGVGGTLYYFDNPDSVTAPTVHQIAFYGLSSYQANESGFANSVYIDTPLTTDANGDVFFGFRVQGTAPAPLSTTQSGYARIDPNGNAKYVLVGNMTGDGSISLDSMNAAPVLSNDGSTLYVLAKSTAQYYGYLVALNATTLGTESKVFLADPRNGAGAGILDVSTASPMVAPDGTVYIGVMGNPYNGSRGFLLHFSANLSQEYTPGAFGWDDTASIVPASMVPGYTGTSSYLIFVKYNNYVMADAGPTGGNGVNEIAILDPYASQPDTRNDAIPSNGSNDPSLSVMKEIMTIAGPTPDTDYTSQFPDAVHEWCINSCVVDPATDSIYANSEDGKLYRWDLATNSFTEATVLTPGLGEAYTPTWMGPDGRVYAINNATLFSVGITGWGGHDGDAFTAPDYSTAPTAAGTTAPHTYVLTGSSVTRDGFAFDYSGVQTLNFYAGSGGNTIDWQGDSAETNLYTGTGVNTINAGDSNNTLTHFAQTVVVYGQGSNNTDNIYNSGYAGAASYILGANYFSANGGLSYSYGYNIQNANYYFGPGGNTIDWQGVASGQTQTVYTGTGTNSIMVGDASNPLDNFQGSAVLVGQGSANTLTIDDSLSSDPHTYDVTGTTVTRDTGGFNFTYSDIQNFSFDAGSGGNRINLSGTAPGTQTTINAGTGGDIIYATDLADVNPGPPATFGPNSFSLNDFLGHATINGQGGNTTLVVTDGLYHTYVLTGSQIVRDGSDVISYSGLQYLYFTDGGFNTFYWQGTAAGTTTELDLVGPDDTINVGDANNTLDGFQGTQIIAGYGSVSNTVNIYDQGSSAPHNYAIDNNVPMPISYNFAYTLDFQDRTPRPVYTVVGSSLSRDGMMLDYSGVDRVNFYAGSGGNTIDWQGNLGDSIGTLPPDFLSQIGVPPPLPFIPTTVYTGTGANTITLGDGNETLNGFGGIAALVGQGTDNTVNVDDSGSTVPNTYTLAGGTLSRDGFTLPYSNVQSLNLLGGSDYNTIYWQGVAGNEVITVYTGTGTNTIDLGDADDTLNGFLGEAVLQGQGGNNTVNVFDNGLTTVRGYVITPTSFSFTSGASYDYFYDVQTVNYFLGDGGNIVDWEGIAAGTTETVYTGNSPNTIVMADANDTLDGFQGTAVLVGQGTSDSVTLNDSGSTTPYDYTLTATSISREGFDLNYSGPLSLYVYGGQGGNTFNWQGNSTPETLFTGAGVNTINFGDADNTLNSFADYVTLYGQGSNNTVNDFTEGTTTAQNYLFGTTPSGATTFSVTGGNGYTYAYDIQTVNQFLGSGGNTIDWQGVLAGQTFTVFSGTGTNTVTLGDANGTLDGFQGTAVLVGQGDTSLTVDDAGSTAAHTYQISGSTITRDGSGLNFSYSGVQSVAFDAGSGGNIIGIVGTAPGITTTVNAGPGGDTIFAFDMPANVSDINNDSFTLDNFFGPLAINGAGNTVMSVDDGYFHTFTLTGSEIVRDGTPLISYHGLSNLYFNDAGDNTFNWQGTAAGTTTELDYIGPGDTINVGDANNTLDGFLGTPIIATAGDNTLNIYDQGSSTPHDYAIASGVAMAVAGFAPGVTADQTTGALSYVSSPASSPVTGSSFTRDGLTLDYFGIYSVNFYAGSGGNTIDWQGNTGDNYGTLSPPGSSGLPGFPPPPAYTPTTIYAGAGGDTVNVGNAGNTLDNFGGTVNLVGQASNTTVNINDQGSTTGHTYTLTATSVARDSFALDYSGVETLTVSGGSGGNTIDWVGDSAPNDTVYTGTGTNTINFGDAANTLNSFAAYVTLYGQGDDNTVNVYGQGNTAASSVILGTTPSGASTFSANGGVNYSYAYDIQALNYYFGSGGNTIDWQGTVAGQIETVYGGTGVNSIIFGDANNTLDEFIGEPVFQGQGSNNTVTVNDSGNTVSTNYVVAPDKFSTSGGNGFGYGYDVQFADFFFGTGANTVDWQGNDPATTYAANFPGGSDQVSGNYNAAFTYIDGAVSLNASGAGFGNLTVDVFGSLDLSQAASGTLTATSVFNQGVITGSGHLLLADSGNFNTTTNLGLVLGGSVAGSQYDQIQVGGTATLSGSLAISLVPGFVPVGGQTFFIITDTASTPVSGTFFDKPDGSTFQVSGVDAENNPFTTTFRINYTGANVILTDISSPQVTANNAAVTVVVGQTATNSGNWSQAGFTGTDTITASVGTIMQTGNNGSGTWSWSYPTSSVSQSQTVTIYANDGHGNVGSTTFTLTVNPDATTTTVASSLNPSTYGQSVTFTATVSANAPGSGTPTGTVTFLDGTTTLGTGTLSNGTAAFSTSALIAGGHSITVSYAGDGNYSASTSNALTQTVHQSATTSTVVSSANPSVYSQNVTFTATVAAVAPGAGTPTGTVTFLDGTTTLGTGMLSGGTATYSTTALALGNHSITIRYSGDTNFTTSTSSTLVQTVNKDGTTTAVVSSANPSVYGQAVTFTATVAAAAPGTGTPTGTVTFLDGTATLATVNLSGGTAAFTTSSLAVTSHSITARYNASTTFTGSTSSALTQVVSQDGVTATVVSSANPSVFGQKVTFTVTVSAAAPGAGTPSGTVTFLDGTTTLGTASLSGGSASFSTTKLAVGTHSITVTYAGSTNFTSGTSGALSQVVSQDASATTVTSSVDPSAYGQKVTFTATVTAVAPGAGTPTGSVTFLDGTTTLGTGTLNSSGKATLATTALLAGNHSITVSYGGDGNFTVSTSSVLTQTVNEANTTATVKSSTNPTVFGQSVTFTATVAAVSPGAGTPTGTVTFLDGTTTLGTGTLSAGKATFSTSVLAVGSHSISVSYAGDGNFNASTSAALIQTVSMASSTTTVATSVSPSVFGQSVTFTATVAAKSPGAGSPTGMVTFLDGTTTLGTVALSGGTATYTTPALAVGGHSITAQYSGDGNFTASTSSAKTQTVNADTTATSVMSSANPSVVNQSVTFTATVTANAPGSGVPGGTVTFKDGSKTLGASTLNAAGQATFTISTLALGSHSITAVYGGSTSYKTSTSTVLTQVVNATGPGVVVGSPITTPAVSGNDAVAASITVTTDSVSGRSLAPVNTSSTNASGSAVNTSVWRAGSPDAIRSVVAGATQQSNAVASNGTNVAALDQFFAAFGSDGQNKGSSGTDDKEG
jgi:hypothetical protein